MGAFVGLLVGSRNGAFEGLPIGCEETQKGNQDEQTRSLMFIIFDNAQDILGTIGNSYRLGWLVSGSFGRVGIRLCARRGRRLFARQS